jgi:hypothetical protein
MRVIRFSLFLALVMLVIVVGTTRGADDAERLFSPAETPDGLSADGGGPALRQRFVTVDMALLGAAAGQGDVEGKAVQLDLFGGATVTAVPERIESPAAGQIVWQGQVRGQSLGTVTIVVRDGVAAGSMRANGRLYRLYYVGNGVHVLEETTGAEPMAEHPPIAVDPDLLPEAIQNDAQSITADDGTVIDVLVVYTAASRSRYGRAGIEVLIDLAVAETNEAYARSLINTRLSLVAATEVSYAESGDMLTDLGRLKEKNDGYLDSVHAWRDTYAADMVSLIQEASDYCGIAYLMSGLSHNFESLAFSVIDSDCATGYYSFGHELGHNMGSHHDRANARSTPLFNYSYGYQAPDTSFRTIMAYNCPGNCIRVQRFSNPDVWYNGQPTGIRYSDNPAKAANNARSINEASYTVANWRDSATRPLAAPTSLTAVALSPTRIELSWQDNANQESGYKIQRRIDGQSWALIVDLPANSTNFDDTGRSADTTYEYRVWSYASDKESNFSNVARVSTPRYPELHIGVINGAGAVESGLVEGDIIWRAYVAVEVHDAYHSPVNGALVSGAWSGGASGSGNCVTDNAGRCSVVKTGLGSNIDSVTFTVGEISNGSDPYKPDHNHDPACNGSSVTANRPVGALYLPKINHNS